MTNSSATSAFWHEFSHYAAQARIEKNAIEVALLHAPTYAYWIPVFAGMTSEPLGNACPLFALFWSGTRQPAAFFGADAWAAPIFGSLGGLIILALGLSYLEWRRRNALAAGEGYGSNLINEPAAFAGEKPAHPLIALLPLLIVGIANKTLGVLIPKVYAERQRQSFKK